MKKFFTNLFIALSVAGVGWVISATCFMSESQKKEFASLQEKNYYRENGDKIWKYIVSNADSLTTVNSVKESFPQLEIDNVRKISLTFGETYTIKSDPIYFITFNVKDTL